MSTNVTLLLQVAQRVADDAAGSFPAWLGSVLKTKMTQNFLIL